MIANSCYFVVVVVLVLIGSSDSVHVPFGFPGLRLFPVFLLGFTRSLTKDYKRCTFSVYYLENKDSSMLGQHI